LGGGIPQEKAGSEKPRLAGKSKRKNRKKKNARGKKKRKRKLGKSTHLRGEKEKTVVLPRNKKRLKQT